MDCWRQWIRHRTASVNEYSTRYSVAIDSMQTTLPEEWRTQSTVNRQGSEGRLSLEMGQKLTLAEHEYQGGRAALSRTAGSGSGSRAGS